MLPTPGEDNCREHLAAAAQELEKLRPIAKLSAAMGRRIKEQGLAGEP